MRRVYVGRMPVTGILRAWFVQDGESISRARAWPPLRFEGGIDLRIDLGELAPEIAVVRFGAFVEDDAGRRHAMTFELERL